MTSARIGTVCLLLVTLGLASCGLFITPQHRVATARRDIEVGNWRGASIQLNKAVQADTKNVQAWLLLTEVSLDTADLKDARLALGNAVSNGAKGAEVDGLRVRVWLEGNEPKALLDAVAHHTLNLAEPAQSIAIARAYAALGQNDKAIQTLQPVVQQHPDLTEARVVMAEALADAGRPDVALQQLDTALKHDQKSPEPALLQGRILLSRGRSAEAERSLELAVKRMPASQPIPDRVEALVALTQARLQQGELDGAAQSHASLVGLVPHSPVATLLDARIKLGRHDVRGALDELGLLVLTAPHFTQARMLLGTLDLDQGQFEQTVVQAQAVLQESPHDVAARRLLAAAELKLDHPGAALRDLAPALAAASADSQFTTLLGTAASRVGDAQSVLDRLEREGTADVHNPAVRLNLAQAYLSARRPGDALSILEQTAESDSLRRDSLLIVAVREAKGPRAAAKQVDELLAAHPHNFSMISLAASYFGSQRDFKRAQALLRQALTEKPNDPATAIELARVDIAAGDVASAGSTLKSALDAHPQAFALRLALADVLLRTEAYAQARKLLEAAAPSGGGGPALEMALARVDLAAGQLAQANADIDQAIGSGPDRVARLKQVVALLISAKQPKVALARVDALLASDSADPSAFVLKGDVETALGHAKEAAAAYRQAQKLRPTAAVAVGLYRAQLASGEPQPEKPLQEWLAQSPHDWPLQEILGEYYVSVHSLKPAAAAFAAVLEDSPKNVIALNNLAWIYQQLGDRRAESLAAQAYQIAPQLPSVNDTLGWIRAQRGDTGRALPLLAYAVKAAPSNPDFEFHYAYALDKSGQRAAARKILAKLLATPVKFDSRAQAEQLLGATGGGRPTESAKQ
jgi:tetratricopeptide (TPR) repeat protein